MVDTLACQPVPPLGLGIGQPELATAALEPADRVLFYTDGVTEGRNLDGEPFGEGRLADLLVRETLAGQPAAETMRRLARAILAHQGRLHVTTPPWSSWNGRAPLRDLTGVASPQLAVCQWPWNPPAVPLARWSPAERRSPVLLGVLAQGDDQLVLAHG